MTTDLREFKVGDVIQDKKRKSRIYIVGEIEHIDRLQLYDLDGDISNSIRIPKGSPMELTYKYSYKDDAKEEVCDFQFVDVGVVEKYYVSDGEETEKFRKKLEELKNIQQKE